MYLDHFGLAVNPFGLSPKLEFLYQSGAFEESMAHLIYGVENSEAIIMITGAIGTGKTMALQSFMANLNQGFQWALVTNTQVTPVELLKLILDDLGVKFPPGCDKSDLLILFKEFLVNTSHSGQHVIIIIDEAQNMAREVLEEVRLLTNLGQGDIQPVQVILVGQPELEAVVNRSDLAQLRQRIRVHYRLDPLSRKEVEEYLNHRMAVAGCKDHVFKSGAIDRIAEASGGVPRLVNSLAGQALLSAFVAGHKQVHTSDLTVPEGSSPIPTVQVAPVEKTPAAPVVNSSETITRTRNPHAVRRSKTKKNQTPLLVALLVILLALAALGLYLRVDLPSIIDRVSPAIPENIGVAVCQDTVAAEVSPEPASLRASQLQAGTVDSVARLNVVPHAQPKFYVQVASFKTPARAEKCCQELQAAGFATLVKQQLISDILWQRVLIGPYSDRASAKEGLGFYKQPEENDYFPITVVEPDSGS